MPPNVVADNTGVLMEDDREVSPQQIEDVLKQSKNRKLPIVWRDVIKFAILHAIGVYGLYLMFTSARIWTSVLGTCLPNQPTTFFIISFLFFLVFVNYHLGILGITAGAHRLWAHRSYKARWPLKLFLAYIQTLAFQVI